MLTAPADEPQFEALLNCCHFGDCIETMRRFPDGIVQTCVTSPPYFGLRFYFPDAVRIKSTLTPEKRAWVEQQLRESGVNAHN